MSCGRPSSSTPTSSRRRAGHAAWAIASRSARPPRRRTWIGTRSHRSLACDRSRSGSSRVPAAAASVASSTCRSSLSWPSRPGSRAGRFAARTRVRSRCERAPNAIPPSSERRSGPTPMDDSRVCDSTPTSTPAPMPRGDPPSRPESLSTRPGPTSCRPCSRRPAPMQQTGPVDGCISRLRRPAGGRRRVRPPRRARRPSGIDPLELRLRNALRAGDRTATGQELRASAGLAECLEALRPRWTELRAEAAPHGPVRGPAARRRHRGAAGTGSAYRAAESVDA